MSEPLTLDLEQIRSTLPHRYAFLLVDQVVDLVPGEHAVGIKNVTGNEEFFHGHFPQRPVMPGVLVTEAMTQVAELLLIRTIGSEGKVHHFDSMDRVRFRKQVVPGDRLVTEVTLSSRKGNSGKVRMVGKVNGDIAAEGEAAYVLTDLSYAKGHSPQVPTPSPFPSGRSIKSDATEVHPTSWVAPRAELGVGVKIGPYSLIEGDVKIGDRCVIESHAVVKKGTTLGCDCRISPNVVLGHEPQDSKFHGEDSFVLVGNRNIFREGATVHRATGEGNATALGDENMLMAYSHVGHNCQLGSGLMIANYTGISGHVVIEDRVVIGGMVGIHQFVHVGKLAMLAGYARVTQDVPPFMMGAGLGEIVGLNVVGLRRSGVDQETRNDLKKAYRLLYRSNLNTSQAINRIEKDIRRTPELEYLLAFLEKIRLGKGGRQEEAPRR